MTNKKFKLILIIAAIIFIVPEMFTAQSTKPLPKDEVLYSTSNLINDTRSFTNVKPQQQEFSTEKKNLLSQLDAARQSNDMIKKAGIEEKINTLEGNKPVPLTESTDIIGQVMADHKTPFINENDYMTSAITNYGGYWSSATQTVPAGAPNAGRIWVATTAACIGGTDTLKFYYSDNGGESWNFGYQYYFNFDQDFSPGELDMEIIYDGSAVWLFTIGGYRDHSSSRNNSILLRINTATNTYNPYILNWPGSNANNMYYNPRITSDNSNYTLSTYIYLTCAFDSLYSGNQHTAKQKYAHITNPFDANPVINYTQPTPYGGFYWNSGGGSYYYYWSDIAYFRTQTNANRVITIFDNTGNNNEYIAWTDDYGASIAGNNVLIGSQQKYGGRIAFNGGANNYNGMIAYVRYYAGNDWDTYCWNTTNGGLNWISGYVDNSTFRARSVDIIAPRGAANIFKLGYIQDSALKSFGYYIGGTLNGWNNPPKTVVTSEFVDTSFTKIISGYRNSGTDDCFAVFGGHNGASIYASRLCRSTIGITNNNTGVPKDFALQQNYPNPFNPVTNIKFSIPEGSFVTLTVFDITGKEIASLVNEHLAAGNYTYDFSGAALSTGVYLYKISAGNFSSVKKMMLVK